MWIKRSCYLQDDVRYVQADVMVTFVVRGQTKSEQVPRKSLTDEARSLEKVDKVRLSGGLRHVCAGLSSFVLCSAAWESSSKILMMG